MRDRQKQRSRRSRSCLCYRHPLKNYPKDDRALLRALGLMAPYDAEVVDFQEDPPAAFVRTRDGGFFLCTPRRAVPWAPDSGLSLQQAVKWISKSNLYFYFGVLTRGRRVS